MKQSQKSKKKSFWGCDSSDRLNGLVATVKNSSRKCGGKEIYLKLHSPREGPHASDLGLDLLADSKKEISMFPSLW